MTAESFKAMFEHHIDQISKNERDISVIQKENEMQTRIFVKFEESFEKLQDLTESINRLITIHDERIKVQEQSISSVRKDVESDIKELETRLSKKLEDTEARILVKISELKNEKTARDNSSDDKSPLNGIIKKLDAYKWFILGGIFAVGMVMGKTSVVSNIFSIFYYISGIL